jgi:hypothetical protein
VLLTDEVLVCHHCQNPLQLNCIGLDVATPAIRFTHYDGQGSKLFTGEPQHSNVVAYIDFRCDCGFVTTYKFAQKKTGKIHVESFCTKDRSV